MITGGGQLPGLDPAPGAPGDDGGPFVIVTGSGDRIPGSPVFEDRAAAELALGKANCRAAYRGCPDAYQIALAAHHGIPPRGGDQ